MMKLGKVISKSSVTTVTLYSFNLSKIEWVPVPTPIDFQIADEAFGTGGFRKTYKATSRTPGFCRQTWVLKRYIPNAIEGIEATNQTIEGHTRKAVRLHSLAHNCALQLKEKIDKGDLTRFGTTFEYSKVYMGKTIGGEYVTIEEYIDCEFVKYINNNVNLCQKGNEISDKAECFAQFTYEKSEGKVIVLDIQGAKYSLYDPETASSELLSGDGIIQFCNGNLSLDAIKTFFSNYQCNFYCNLLKLIKTTYRYAVGAL